MKDQPQPEKVAYNKFNYCMVYKINLQGFEQDGKNYAILYYIKKSIQNAFYMFSKKNSIANDRKIEFNDGIEVEYVGQNTVLMIEMGGIIYLLTPLQQKIIR
ncbi:MAG: hypothetical protein WAX04_05820 [Oscillospiraceae bacterium]